MTDQVLNAHVWFHDDTGGHHAFGPGDTVPEWARNQVGAHLLTKTATIPTEDALDALIRAEADRFAGEFETPAVAAPPPDLPPAAGPTPDTEPVERFTILTPPPAAGPGASRTAWADYARDLGIDVGTSWTRADIQDACERVAEAR